MKRTMKSLVLGVTSGMLEYIIILLFSIVPYCKASSFMFRMVIAVLSVMGVFIAAVTLLYGNKSLCQIAFRWLCMVLAFVFFFLINAYIGTINHLRGFFNISINSATENVCGMLSLGFFLTIQVVCLTTVVVSAIVKIVKRVACKSGGLKFLEE